MATLDLKELYESKAFTDLTIIASDGPTFTAHKIVIRSSLGLKELIQANGDRLELPETARVIERLLQWLYTVPWAGMRVDLEGGLGELQDLAEVAEKYRMPKLQENILAVLRNQVVPRLVTPQQAIRAITGLCDDNLKGTVQKMLLGRALELVTVTEPWSATVIAPPAISQEKRRRSSNGIANQYANEPAIDQEIDRTVKRAKKEPKKRGRPSTKPLESPESLIEPPKLHCVCKTSEHDLLLVQCDGCDEWFHPACIGKSGYDERTMQQHKIWAMEMDCRKLMGDKAFKCLECDKAS